MAQKVTIQEAKTRLDRMNLVDRFLFDEVMEYQDAFEAAVSILLSEEIRLLGRAETEKEFRLSPELRQTRLDSVAVDERHRVFMVEMQKRNTKNLKKRSRFYQGHVDVSLLVPGTVDFNSLRDVCQIMVTPFDLFDRGRYRYTFRGVCVECPDLEIGDGAWRVFINTKGKNSGEFTQEFLDFMEYITESTDARAQSAASGRIEIIHKRVKEVKQSEKTGVKVVQRWEELALEREEGKAEGKAESILDLLGELGEIPEDIEERVWGQKEDGILRSWLKLAARAERIDDFRREINLCSEGAYAVTFTGNL